MKTMQRTKDNVGQQITTNEQLFEAVANHKQVWYNEYTNPIPAACIVCMQYNYVAHLLEYGHLYLYKPKNNKSQK